MTDLNALAERLESRALFLRQRNGEDSHTRDMDQAAQALRGMGWKPIETHPREEWEPFLVAIPDENGRGDVLRAAWDRDALVDATYDPYRNACEDATHWQPLPELPRSALKGGGLE